MPSRSIGGNVTQDWDPVVVSRPKATKAAELRDPKAVAAAVRGGGAVERVKKASGGTNRRAPQAEAQQARKLEEQTEAAPLERVAAEVRVAIQKARLAKKMSQAELAKRINERVQVVQEYEAGKALPNQAVLAKMERVLELKLREKK